MARRLCSQQELDAAVAQGVVLVDVYATWCGPCMRLAPAVHRLAAEHAGLTVCQVDYDEAGDLCAALRIESLPTFLLYAAGQLVRRVEGADWPAVVAVVRAACEGQWALTQRAPATDNGPGPGLAAGIDPATSSAAASPTTAAAPTAPSTGDAAPAPAPATPAAPAAPLPLELHHNKAVHRVALSSADLFSDLQRRVEEVTGVPVERQKLVFKGAILPGEHGQGAAAPLSALGLTPQCKVYVVGQSGGVPKAPLAAERPVFSEDVTEALGVCSAVHLGDPILQPVFEFCLDQPEVPPLRLCGPCAEHCRASDAPQPATAVEVVDVPFRCECSTIVQLDRPCIFRNRPAHQSTDFRQALLGEWHRRQREQREGIARARQEELDRRRRAAEDRMTSSLAQDCRQVAQYESELAQRKALAVIPLATLRQRAEAESDGPPPDPDALLRQLLRWFKREFFAWVDTLPCPRCGGGTVNAGATPPTPEDIGWGAPRVELHRCEACGVDVRFPRYNDPTRLLETRRGRCGEWANCFALCCIACGFETRWVHDHTDHVWCEVWSATLQRWAMCDPCEEVWDQPLLYEGGWGKKLTYIFAFSQYEVRDVIRKYTANYDDVLTRRTEVTEDFLQTVLAGFHQDRLRRAPAAHRAVLEQRWRQESAAMQVGPAALDADTSLGGRQTGSLEWRRQRGENGARPPDEGPNSASSSSSSSFTSSPASPPGEAATRTPSPPPAPRAPDKVPLIFRYSSFPASVVANLRTANAPVAELWDETATQKTPSVAGTNPASSLVLLGAAAVRTERLWLLAPTESGAEVGAVWHRGLHPVDGAFSARFEVVLDDLTRSLRSGFGFVMQRSAQLTRAISAGAESHGYRGIDHSVTIAFDTNSRPRCPHPPGLHVSVFAQGRDPERGRVLRCGEVGGLLREGEAYPVVVKYSRRELEVFIGGASCLTCAVDIAEWVGHPAALIGFVAGGPSPGNAAALCLLQAWSFGGRGGGDAEAAPTEASPTPSDPPSAPAPPPPAPSPAPPPPPTSLSAASRPAPARAGADAAAEAPGAAPAGQPAGAPNVAQGPAGGPEAAALQAAREVLRRRLAGQQSSRRKPVLTSWPVLLTAGLVALVAVMYQSTLLPLTPA